MTARKRLASALQRAPEALRYSEHGPDGPVMFAHACRMGLEGDRLEAEGPGLQVRPLPALAQDPEPRLSSAGAARSFTSCLAGRKFAAFGRRCTKRCCDA